MSQRAPSPDAPPPALAARAAAPPRVETVRVTAPDLARRAGMDRTRNRLVLTAAGFALLFGAVAVKLAGATVVFPLQPRRVERATRAPEQPAPDGGQAQQASAVAPPRTESSLPRTRALVTDRNGEILAISLPTSGLFANPREILDAAEAARKLKGVLPRLDEEQVRARLGSERQFVYIARQVTPREQLAVNALGIPGIYFQPTERRRYPQGRLAAHVTGGVDVDARGIAGIEKFFDQRLREDGEPLRLSLDLRVQGVVREELSRAMGEFRAIGACGIVMDVRTGEVLAMVSLPDFDANKPGDGTPEQRFNRAVTGVYEPGSTFKLQTAAMALDLGVVNIWNGFDASRPIQIGRFTISDFEGKKRYLAVPEIIAYSSNIGAARMAEATGGERQRDWLRRMGMFERVGVELPEVSRPIYQATANWRDIATMTVGFGHGIAVTPLQVVAGTAAIANGGTYMRPTLLAPEPGMPPREGTRVMQQGTSDTMRKLMRLVVSEGFGKNAEVPGYYPGGKTGTAEKTAGRGYNHNNRISAFMSAFPMQAPRYAVYMMLDEPKANASTHGYATAGWVSAPAAGRVIARIGPMLGVMPDTANAAAINAALYIPLQPGRPAGGRGNPPVASAPHRGPSPAAQPAAPARPAPRDQGHRDPSQRDAERQGMAPQGSAPMRSAVLLEPVRAIASDLLAAR